MKLPRPAFRSLTLLLLLLGAFAPVAVPFPPPRSPPRRRRPSTGPAAR